MADHKHEFKIEGAFLHTRIAQIDREEKEKLEDLGIPMLSIPSVWVYFPIVVDLRNVIAVQQTQNENPEGEEIEETILFIEGDSFCVDAPYEDVVKAWVRQRNILIVR